MNLRVCGVQIELGGSLVVKGVDLDVATGHVMAIVGPNGSGKTTLLRAIYRSLRPQAGTVLIAHPKEELNVWTLPAREVARRIAVLTQDRVDDFELSVTEVVLTGRTPHKRLLERDSAADHELVAQLLDEVGVGWAAGRYFSSLSGGEKQRVMLAKALAQKPEFLLLDEPTNHLDVSAQCALLNLLRRLAEDQGLTVVTILHDLNLAAAYSDTLVVLDRGRVAAAGRSQDVLTQALLQKVFGVHAHCGLHPETGNFHIALHMRPASSSQPDTHDRPRP
ncbi:MAG TPA: ABC transporter ATP-binding protein [Pseudonocardiaceae bacterium]|nr:ABC transporter ATP-binding protein [Pseudonocardiaceae bacterium]